MVIKSSKNVLLQLSCRYDIFGSEILITRNFRNPYTAYIKLANYLTILNKWEKLVNYVVLKIIHFIFDIVTNNNLITTNYKIKIAKIQNLG